MLGEVMALETTTEDSKLQKRRVGNLHPYKIERNKY